MIRAGAWVLALVVSSALAQKAERPDVKVGDRWQFVVYYASPSTKPNRNWVITSVTPAGIDGTENGEALKMTPELNVLESPRSKDSNPKSLSFPLEVGKRWRYASVKSVHHAPYLGTSTVELVEFQLRP